MLGIVVQVAMSLLCLKILKPVKPWERFDEKGIARIKLFCNYTPVKTRKHCLHQSI